MNVIEFFLPSKPKPKGNSKKIIKIGGRFSLTSNIRDKKAENTLAARVLEFRPDSPMTGPVRLDVTFVMPMPGNSKWKHKAMIAGEFHHVTTPDRGNLLKLIEDVLEGPFVVNDKQICGGEVAKVYGEIPGYKIKLTELEQAAYKGRGK